MCSNTNSKYPGWVIFFSANNFGIMLDLVSGYKPCQCVFVCVWVCDHCRCPSHICLPSLCLITAHIPQHCLLWLCKMPGAFFPRHRDKERKSEPSYLWQYQGEQALRCLGDSVVIGTKQIKCQPFKRWLGSRGSGQANSLGKQSAAILFSPSAAVLTFFAWITWMDILKNSPVVAPRSRVRLQADIYNYVKLVVSHIAVVGSR